MFSIYLFIMYSLYSDSNIPVIDQYWPVGYIDQWIPKVAPVLTCG